MQGVVLGPTLFNIYVNDIFWLTTNHLTLWTDDSKLFDAVNHESLQADLDHIQIWAKTWHMSFNVDKSGVIHFGKSNPGFEYAMINPVVNNIQELQSVEVQIITKENFWKLCVARVLLLIKATAGWHIFQHKFGNKQNTYKTRALFKNLIENSKRRKEVKIKVLLL